MRNASLPNIFLASKSFSQSYLADFSLPCIVPHKAMQSFLYPISHTLSLTRAYAYTRVITANYVFCCHKCHASRRSWWKILPNFDHKRVQSRRKDKRRTRSKIRRQAERRVEKTPLPKAKTELRRNKGKKKESPRRLSRRLCCAQPFVATTGE